MSRLFLQSFIALLMSQQSKVSTLGIQLIDFGRTLWIIIMRWKIAYLPQVATQRSAKLMECKTFIMRPLVLPALLCGKHCIVYQLTIYLFVAITQCGMDELIIEILHTEKSPTQRLMVRKITGTTLSLHSLINKVSTSGSCPKLQSLLMQLKSRVLSERLELISYLTA